MTETQSTMFAVSDERIEAVRLALKDEPCHYCGAESSLHIDRKHNRHKGITTYRFAAECGNSPLECEVFPATNLHDTPEEALKAWRGKR